MKYLKLYEEFSYKNTKFKRGDYVVANITKKYLNDHGSGSMSDINDICEFINKSVGKIITIHNFDNIFYDVLYADVPNNDNFKRHFNFVKNRVSYFISASKLRLATPEEIEEYEIKQNIKNFNL